MNQFSPSDQILKIFNLLGRGFILIFNIDIFIYLQTYIGGILVAVNPYKNLNIYSENFISKYQGKRLFEQDPHIFAIAAQALDNLKRQLHNQCIVIR